MCSARVRIQSAGNLKISALNFNLHGHVLDKLPYDKYSFQYSI